MAKKKVTTTTTEEEIDNKDLHNATMTDIVEGKDISTDKTSTKEEPKIETKEEEVEFDPDKFKSDVTAEAEKKAQAVSEATLKKMMEAVTGTKEVDEKDQELIAPWTKENRTPKTYDEVAEWGAERRAILDRREKEMQTKKDDQRKKEIETYNKQQVDSYNKYVDEQLNDLYSSNKLPKIIDVKNEHDEGVVARKALFTKMLEVNQQRTKEGKAPIYSLKEIYYEHYKAPNKQPAGADAPIAGSRSGATTDTNEINYTKDIKHKSLIDILMKR